MTPANRTARKAGPPRKPSKAKVTTSVRHASPHFAPLRKHCLAFPDATEDFPWGDIAYKVKGKLFAVTGPSMPLRVTVKATPEGAMTLLQHKSIERAHYVGRYGWVTVTVESRKMLDLTLALVTESYELIRKPKKK